MLHLLFLLTATTIQLNTIDYPELLSNLAQCESHNTQWIVHRDDGFGDSYSWLQFKPSTFRQFGERYHLPHSDIFSKEQQFAIAEQMLSEGRWMNWKVCSKKLGIDKYYE